MPLSTYAELKASIANWLNRDDLGDEVADFVTLAEAQMQRDIKHWRGEKRATASFSTRFTALPDDFLAPIRLQIANDKHPLSLVNAFEMHEMRSATADTAGRPRYYAVIDESFEVYPTPDETYTGTLFYRRTIPKLTDSNTSNWLLDLAPDAYLYASLLASAPFLQHDERMSTWSPLYLAAIQGINNDSEKGTHGGTLRMRIGAAPRVHSERY